MSQTHVNDIQPSTTTKVYCDGYVDSGGHPRIYLDLSKTGKVVCPYCSKTFTLNSKDA